MARTPAQRGTVGNWLVESRMARGWETQAKARSEIERLTGWRIPQSVYAEWESGRRLPSDANLAKLQEFYGAPARPGSTETTDTLVEAIRAQTEAISELAAALRELLSIPVRPDTAEVSEARRILAEAALSGLAEGERRADEGPESRAPSPGRLPRGTEARSA